MLLAILTLISPLLATATVLGTSWLFRRFAYRHIVAHICLTLIWMPVYISAFHGVGLITLIYVVVWEAEEWLRYTPYWSYPVSFALTYCLIRALDRNIRDYLNDWSAEKNRRKLR